MYPFASRGSRLRPVLVFLVAAIAGACADDQSVTAPRPNAVASMGVASTDAALDLADIPTVTITPARTGSIRVKEGFVELSATVDCSKSGLAIRVAAYLKQQQRPGNIGVAGSGESDVACVAGVAVPFFIPVVMNPLNPLPERGKADVLFKVLTTGVSASDVERAVRLVEAAP